MVTAEITIGYKFDVIELGGIVNVSYENDFGNTLERKWIFLDLTHDEYGVDRVLFLRKHEHIRQILDAISSDFFGFYSGLMGSEVIDKFSYENGFDVLVSRAFDSLSMIHGEDAAVFAFKEYMVAYCINAAREQIIENIRCTSHNAYDFYSSLTRFLDILVFEADRFVTPIPYFPSDVIHDELFLASWLFYDSRKICTFENFSNGNLFGDIGPVLWKRSSVLSTMRVKHSQFAEVCGIKYPDFPIRRLIGLAGAGKTRTRDLIARILEDPYCLEGTEKIKYTLDERYGLVRRKMGLREKLRLAYKGSPEEELLKKEYRLVQEAYWSDRMAAVDKLRLDIVDSLREGRPVIMDSMPTLPAIARFAENVVSDFLTELGDRSSAGVPKVVLEELNSSPVIYPERYYRFIWSAFSHNPYIQSVACSVAELLLVDYMKEIAFYDPCSCGFTVYIDVPPDICEGRVRQSSAGDKRALEMRLQDAEYWLSWRLAFAILADIHPLVGKVSAVLPDGRELDKLQVAMLADTTLGFLRVTEFASSIKDTRSRIDCLEEMKGSLRRLQKEIELLFSSNNPPNSLQ